MKINIETKTKRRIYIFLAVVLGVLLGLIAYALLEKAQINAILSLGEAPVAFYGRCYLPPGVAITFLIGGMMLGYVLGVRWWQIIYVEKRHWRKWKNR